MEIRKYRDRNSVSTRRPNACLGLRGRSEIRFRSVLSRSGGDLIDKEISDIGGGMLLIDNVLELLIRDFDIEGDIREFKGEHGGDDFFTGICLEVGDDAGEEGFFLEGDSDPVRDEGG